MMKQLYIYSALLLFAEYSVQNCTQIEKNLFNIHGIVLKISVPTQVTLCTPDVVVRDAPILLDNYTEYFKLKSKHPRIRKQEDKVQYLYSNMFIHLPYVKTLIASQLELENIESGAFKGIHNLRYLNLYSNQLTHLPEDVFDDVPNLVELNLNDNKLELLKSKQFRELTHLETLRLSTNRLKELPDQLFINQNQLIYLSFTKNLFSSLKRNVFNGLEKLNELKLLMNELGLIEEDAFRGLFQLEHLALEYNQMIIFFDVARAFESMPNLKRLSMSPENFQCITYHQILEASNKSKIEILELPMDSESCIAIGTISKFS